MADKAKHLLAIRLELAGVLAKLILSVRSSRSSVPEAAQRHIITQRGSSKLLQVQLSGKFSVPKCA